MSKRAFSKFVRPFEPTGGVITDRDLDIVEAILRYRFSPSSQLVRLVGGNEDVTFRRLRRLWEKGLINRWAFPGIRTFHFNEAEFSSLGIPALDVIAQLVELAVCWLKTELSLYIHHCGSRARRPCLNIHGRSCKWQRFARNQGKQSDRNNNDATKNDGRKR